MRLNEFTRFPKPELFVQMNGPFVSPVYEEDDPLELFKQSLHMCGDDRSAKPPPPAPWQHVDRPDLADLPIAGIHPCKGNRFLIEKERGNLTPFEAPYESTLCPDVLNLGPAHSELLHFIGHLKGKEDTGHLRRRAHTGVTAVGKKILFLKLHMVVLTRFLHTQSGGPQELFNPLPLSEKHGRPWISQVEKGLEPHSHLLAHFRQEEEMKIFPIFCVHKPHIRHGPPDQEIFTGPLPSDNSLVEIEVNRAILF